MTLTADQYFQISQGYAKAAADPFVPPEGREAFANKAEWFDFLGRREGGALHSDANAWYGPQRYAALRLARELNYSERPETINESAVTTLWLTGAALYLIGILLFTDALNLFGGDDRQEVASRQVASIDGNAKLSGWPPAERARPHILPGQPSYETHGSHRFRPLHCNRKSLAPLLLLPSRLKN